MDEPLYDEFGNYIGPELRSSDSEAASDSDSERDDASDVDGGAADDDDAPRYGYDPEDLGALRLHVE